MRRGGAAGEEGELIEEEGSAEGEAGARRERTRARGKLDPHAHTPYTSEGPRVSFAACLSEMVSRRVEPRPRPGARRCFAQAHPAPGRAGREGKRRGEGRKERGSDRPKNDASFSSLVSCLLPFKGSTAGPDPLRARPAAPQHSAAQRLNQRRGKRARREGGRGRREKGEGAACPTCVV
jgi:hypothetical protein